MQKATNPRRAKGRPRIDDRDQILAHFSQRISKGQSVSQTAKAGLTIYRLAKCNEVDCPQLEIERRLQGRSLERRYRKILAEIVTTHERISTVTGKENARMIGISRPRPPGSFTHDRALYRGRPKKIRRI